MEYGENRNNVNHPDYDENDYKDYNSNIILKDLYEATESDILPF